VLQQGQVPLVAAAPTPTPGSVAASITATASTIAATAALVRVVLPLALRPDLGVALEAALVLRRRRCERRAAAPLRAHGDVVVAAGRWSSAGTRWGCLLGGVMSGVTNTLD
jgi:hypothetical protein